MRRPALASILSALAVAVLLTACNDDSDSAGGGALRPGHYFILSDSDDPYNYYQFFVVRPGSRFEFVEYGLDDRDRVCQVTRMRGTYAFKDSSALILTGTQAGDSMEKCPMSQADFDAYPFENAPPGVDTRDTVRVRNVTDSSFDAMGAFIGADGWETYYREEGDPYGYFD